MWSFLVPRDDNIAVMLYLVSTFAFIVKLLAEKRWSFLSTFYSKGVLKTTLHEGWKWYPFLFLFLEKKRYNEQPDPCGHAQKYY
ncbi:hypothetical protein [Flavobacterium sp. 5]|uniref:hypothetical protein n=1 Tax=Flavobacterium sp. 5 TaxID=2035199 RepID=UPI0012FDBE45|nr:hypothetical protein [Flavobacterium sp. 5]